MPKDTEPEPCIDPGHMASYCFEYQITLRKNIFTFLWEGRWILTGWEAFHQVVKWEEGAVEWQLEESGRTKLGLRGLIDPFPWCRLYLSTFHSRTACFWKFCSSESLSHKSWLKSFSFLPWYNEDLLPKTNSKICLIPVS